MKNEITNYKCEDCNYEFKSNLKKLDAICPKCHSIHIKHNEIITKIENENKSKELNLIEININDNLVITGKKLLDSVIQAADAYAISDLDKNNLAKMKLVLGYLNAYNNIIKTKIEIVKTINYSEKVKSLESIDKSRYN